jgi:soluble lytic murein transglycosylase-like protein
MNKLLRYLSPLCLLGGIACLAPQAVQADIYGYVDSHGTAHFSPIRKDTRYTLFSKGAIPRHRVRAVIIGSRAPLILSGAGRTARVAAARRAVHPVILPARLHAEIAAVARKQGVHRALLQSVVATESSGNPYAISPKGAIGLMQLMPSTARLYGVKDPINPHANLRGGARLLRYLINKYHGNLRLALAAYNAGEGNVQKYGNHVPPFHETQSYVATVLSRYQRYLGK